jgi:uncharacterized protein YegL
MAKKVSKKKSDRTYVVIVLDKSGSMGGTQEQTISGYNEQIQQLREDAKETEILASLITFNGDVFEHFWNVPAADLQEANVSEYVPNGGTAMRDAIGYAIKRMEETTDVKDENNAYLFIVISDGMENSSTHFTKPELRALISKYQESGSWTFTYMGCDASYLEKVAEETSMKLANMAVYENRTARGTTRGMHENKMKLAGFFTERKKGNKASMNYFSAQDGVLADYSQDTEESLPDMSVQGLNWSVPNTPNSNHLADSPKIEVTAFTTNGFGKPKSVTWTSNYKS